MHERHCLISPQFASAKTGQTGSIVLYIISSHDEVNKSIVYTLFFVTVITWKCTLLQYSYWSPRLLNLKFTHRPRTIHENLQQSSFRWLSTFMYRCQSYFKYKIRQIKTQSKLSHTLSSVCYCHDEVNRSMVYKLKKCINTFFVTVITWKCQLLQYSYRPTRLLNLKFTHLCIRFMKLFSRVVLDDSQRTSTWNLNTLCCRLSENVWLY